MDKNEMSDTPLVKKYIDSVDGMAHQSAIEIIINLEKEIEAAKTEYERAFNYECALQEISRLRGTVTHLRVELEKKAAGTYEDGYENGYQAGMAEKKPWVGLTDKEIAEIYNQDSLIYKPLEFYRALEAKLKDKNGG